MLERAPVVGDYLMWPDQEGYELVYVHHVHKEEFAVTYISNMFEDNVARSVRYVMTGHEDWVSEEDTERYLKRAELIRFATPEEIAGGLRVSEDSLAEKLENARKRVELLSANLTTLKFWRTAFDAEAKADA